MDLDIKFAEIAEMNESATFEKDFRIRSVSTDTRHISDGDTFVAIHGEKYDGHDFIDAAISNGAAAVISSRHVVTDVPVMVVKDTIEALGSMASVFRNKFRGKVVGITGSNGKTTVKEMLKNICTQSMSVSATVANNNNKIGVPLTVLSASQDDDVWLVEMGTSEKGEIPYLANMVRPDISIITNISESHLEGFGTREDVFLEKSAIFASMKDNGVAMMNYSPPWFDKTRDMFKTANLVSFGLDHNADIHCEYESHAAGFSVKADTGDRTISYTLKVPGEHNVINSLAAIGASVSMHVGDEDIVRGLEGFHGIKGRMEVKTLGNGITLIDDTYNASPASVKAALLSLSLYNGRRVFVFGGMAELGEKSEGFHAEVGDEAMNADVDSLYVLGDSAKPAFDSYPGEKYFAENIQDLLHVLDENIRPDDVVLVKGSRAFRMERVTGFLEGKRR